MAVITVTDLADLVSSTLRDLGPNRFQNIAPTIQHYEIVGRWFRRDKVVEDGGRGISRNLKIAHTNTARHVGLTDVLSSNIPTLMTSLTVDPVLLWNEWSFLRDEVEHNTGREAIYNVIKPKRQSCLEDIALLLEQKGWSVPASGSQEPYGIPYYVVFNNSTDGFTGGAPSGYTTVAGVNPSTYTNWKNYSYKYTNASKPDLITKMRKTLRYINWISPVSNQDYSRGQFNNYRIYTDETTLESFESIGEAQNENLGRDLAPYGTMRDVKMENNQLVFRRHPIIWIRMLDDTNVMTSSVAVNPVYMIDHSTYYPVVWKGDVFREDEPIRLQNQPRTFRVDVWLKYNYLCVNRRANAVLSKATS